MPPHLPRDGIARVPPPSASFATYRGRRGDPHLPTRLLTKTMRRLTLLLALCLLALTATVDCVAQGMTTTRRIRGNDRRGKYDIAWLRLTERFADAVVRARVNRDLEHAARSHICPADAGRFLESEFSMEVTYLSPRVLGVSTFEFSFCGGANPTHGTRGLLYDLRAGRRIEVENQVADPRAFRRFVDRRVLATKPRDAGECADTDTWTSYIYILKERDLSVTQDLPNVIMACAYETLIPHADLIPFLEPGSPLRTLAPRGP